MDVMNVVYPFGSCKKVGLVPLEYSTAEKKIKALSEKCWENEKTEVDQ